MLNVSCPQCSCKMRAPEGLLGKTAKCGNCAYKFVIHSQPLSDVDFLPLEPSETPPVFSPMVADESCDNSALTNLSRRRPIFPPRRRISWQSIGLIGSIGVALCAAAIWLTTSSGQGGAEAGRAAGERIQNDIAAKATAEAERIQKANAASAAAEAQKIHDATAAAAERAAEMMATQREIGPLLINARRAVYAADGREREFDGVLSRELGEAQNAVVQAKSEQAIAFATERVRVLRNNIALAAQRRAEIREQLTRAEEKRLEDSKMQLAQLTPDQRQEVTRIGEKISAGGKMTELEARFLYQVGLGNTGKAREFFLGMLTEGDAAALTALGESPEPQVRETLVAVEGKLEATVATALRLFESDQVPNRQEVDKLRSDLKDQVELLGVAKDLVDGAKDRFEGVRLRFAQRLSGGERATVRGIAARVTGGEKPREGEARFLLKVGFGVEYAEQSLRAGQNGQDQNLRKLLSK